MSRQAWALVCFGIALVLGGCGGGSGPATPPEDGGSYVVLGYGDMGMHWMDEDFSELMLSPPLNTLRAQVVRRGPRIVNSGVSVRYQVPSNTHSADKTNFWRFAEALFGTPLARNVGLTGNGLAGTMSPRASRDWEATGIPLTPALDSGQDDPYPLVDITVSSGGQELGRTAIVAAVSWEINCDLCHNTPGISTATDILRDHDRLHGTNLESSRPVACGSCHNQRPLESLLGPGNGALPPLSTAIHRAHASRMGVVGGLAVSCYACHPGVQDQYLRGVHAAEGMTCLDCHTSMTAVANPARHPWVDEPRCGDCHNEAGFAFEPQGKLFKDSRGHHGVHCAACHGSPHAITPTITPRDNQQAMDVQGHRGPIDTCSVCHPGARTRDIPHGQSS